MRRSFALSLRSVGLVAGAATSFAAISLGACSSFNATQDNPDGSVAITTDALVRSESASDSDAGSDADAATASMSAYRKAVMADGPIAYWRMDTTGSLLVPDETGRSNDLLLQGAPGSFARGVPGALIGDDSTAIRFDGLEGHAIATDAAPFDFPARAPFTIELWAKRDPIDGGATFQELLSHGQGPQGDRTGFSLQVVFDTSTVDGVRQTAFEYNAYDGGDQRVLGDLAAVSEWAHYVATFDGTSITVYVNATRGDTRPVAGPITLAPTDLFVGGVAGAAFAGTIDEVAIYDKVLGVSQIAAHVAAAGRQ